MYQTPIERFLEPCILLTLTDGPAHGYALKEHCEVECLVDEPIDVGTLYRTLRRMEAEEWLTSEWADGQGPRRRVYSITQLGRQVLHSWASGLARNKQTIENFLRFYGERFEPQGRKEKSGKSCKPGSC
ncbi:MAG: PadR family transcriptional regulator [Dehalococcoidia bacterium]